MTALAARAAYRLWAPTYSDENAVSAIEDRLVRAITGSLTGRRLLDIGCGTGRRLVDIDTASSTGVDASPEMLAVARATCLPRVRLLQGDVGQLPIDDSAGDVVWCRLVLGHLADADAAYRELSRVRATGGRVIVTDFHPDAHAAGHRRTFRANGIVHEVEHHPRSVEAHARLAAAAGLRLVDVQHGTVSALELRHYAAARREALFDEHRHLRLVLALVFDRAG